MKQLKVSVGVVKNTNGQVLISLRDKLADQGNLWEFPGGKIEYGETAEQAMVRELKEELALKVMSATPLITINHQYADLDVQLNVFSVDKYSGEAKSCEGQAFKWINPAELANYPFPAANQPIIRAAQLPSRYAILDDADEALLIENLHKILIRGIKLIQLRLTNTSPQSLERFLTQAYPICRQSEVSLLINSGVKDAANYAVDGIHLTSQQLMSINKRPSFPFATSKHPYWLAASCHNAQELQHAQAIGVDFVVLAPVLATKTHPKAKPLGWEQFNKLVSQVNLPVYALGGLSEFDLNKVQQAGGQGIAAIRTFLE